MSEYIKDKLIYRYREVSEFSLNELMKDDFVLSSADSFNDKHDMAIAFDLEQAYSILSANEAFMSFLANETAKRRKQTKKERFNYLKSVKGVNKVKAFINFLFTEYIKLLKKRLLVGCFTDVYDNEAMWSHYSKSGTGFVVGYRQNEIEIAIKRNDPTESLFEDVVYGEQPYDITNSFVQTIIENLNNGTIDVLMSDSEYLAINYFVLKGNYDLSKALIKKSNEWNYEKEKRIIMYFFESQGNEHRCVAKVKPKLVILGENMSFSNKFLIASICSKKSIDIYVAENSFRKNSFKVGIRPLLPPELEHLLNDFDDYLKLDGLVN